MDDEQVVAVEAFSSHRYAVEPRAFVVNGERRAVVSVVKQWRTPAHLHFIVRDDRDEFAELIYDGLKDKWLIPFLTSSLQTLQAQGRVR